MFSDWIIDRLAQAVHAEYLVSEQARGVTAGENPSLVPWEELPEALRGSSRAHAAGILDKARLVGCEVVPGNEAPAVPPVELADGEIELLSRAEHERWVAERHAGGWRNGFGPKDIARKTHPDMVDWESLPEEAREKDRVLVRRIPRFLALAGLRFLRTR